ncbi:MAG: DUF58 domain-containing protein [Bacteriovoracia bacterium]
MAHVLSEELLRKVRQIEVTTRKVVTDVMTGQYRSQFKGHGVQFSEHRVYLPGDDIRHIDWKASAKGRDTLIKKFEEERELTVFLVVDLSGSQGFGSSAKLKAEVSAELASMLAYAAVHTGDRVGALLFAGEVEEVVPPQKGRMHVLRIVRKILGFQPKTKGTDLKGALEAADRVMKHAGVVFVLSDFMAQGYDAPLKKLARRHDVVAIWIGDEREQEVPTSGLFHFVDPETGQESVVNTGSFAFRRWIKDYFARFKAETEQRLKSGKIDQLRISTKEDYADALVRYFRKRSSRRR